MLFFRRSLTLAGALIAALALSASMSTSASASPRAPLCGNYPGQEDFWACVELRDAEIVGVGHIDNPPAPMLIGLYRSDGWHEDVHEGTGVRIPVDLLPAGDYSVIFVAKNGYGPVISPAIHVD